MGVLVKTKKRVARLYCGIVFMLSCPACFAGTPPDVAGLTLGMSMSQAKASLQKYDTGIKVVTLYQTANTQGVPGPTINFAHGGSQFNDPRVATNLVGIVIKNAWDQSDKPISDDKTEVMSWGGEVFSVSFAPVGSDLAVSGIARTVIIVSNTGTNGELAKGGPTVRSIVDGLQKKYGPPSDKVSEAGAGLHWVYDYRGRQVGERSPEFRRCELGLGEYPGAQVRTQNTGLDPEHQSRYFPGGIFNLGMIKDALSMASNDVDGGTLPESSPTKLAADIFLQQAIVLNGADKSPAMRKCGTQITFAFDSANGSGQLDDIARDFTLVLADQDKIGFDDKLTAFLKSRLQASAPPNPKLSVPKF